MRTTPPIALALVLLAAPAAVGSAQAPPPGLPDHLAIGVAAAPDESGIYGWMPDTDVPWDYAYQYLAGGVNTGNGWRTWNTDATFPLLYAGGAADQGYLPVFPYYMLLQSTGTCDGCDEAERDLANLNDPAVMAAYYDDFATLMRRLGPGTHDGIEGFGGIAIVHVEPDLSGYAQHAVLDPSRCFGHCTGSDGSPEQLRASVASAGHPDVSGYADTWAGFNHALLGLRDRYAPNVLLAFHVSNWASLHDVGSATYELDAAALGRQVADFAAGSGVTSAPSGTSTYDLVFNDVADRDAGYYRYVVGREDVFWDRLNVELPHFHRWEEYLGAITSALDKPAVVWQIPEGNQRFRTVDNSDGHHQDNRAEYFFEHIAELRDIGVVALLFGRGNGGSTTHHDAARDGVTNPPSFCTTDGVSSGQVCNTEESVHPDDDGGYLRLAAADYLSAPLPLTDECTPVPIERWAGDNRITTAIAVARAGFGEGAPRVVVAAAGDFPDALTAAPLAAALGGPVLLVGASLDETVAAELERLGASEAVIVGGTAAVSADVERSLAARGLSVRRVHGPDRNATAAAIAREIGAPDGEAFVVSGGSFADALSAAPVAAAAGIPLLLAGADLPAATADVLEDLGVDRTVVFGGAAAVSDDAYARLPAPRRVSGPDRYATSVAVAEFALERGHSVATLHAATGTNFPDALAAGPVVGAAGSVLLLVTGADPGGAPTVIDFVERHAPEIERLVVLGGPAAVLDVTADRLACAAG